MLSCNSSLYRVTTIVHSTYHNKYQDTKQNLCSLKLQDICEVQKKFKEVFNLEEMWINFTLVQIVVENLNKYFGIQATVVHLFFLFHCAVVGLLLLFFVWDFFFPVCVLRF